MSPFDRGASDAAPALVIVAAKRTEAHVGKRLSSERRIVLRVPALTHEIVTSHAKRLGVSVNLLVSSMIEGFNHEPEAWELRRVRAVLYRRELKEKPLSKLLSGRRRKVPWSK